LSSNTNTSVASFKAALEDLKKANILVPQDVSIKQAILGIKQRLERQNNKECFKGIFCEKKEVLVGASKG